MSKVLVDRELLELLRNFTVQNDSGVAGVLRGNIDRMLAQPAEAEGVRDYLAEFAEGEIEARTAIEELLAALSAVTAERDRLRKDRDDCVEARVHYAGKLGEVMAERDQLSAEAEALRALLSKSLPVVEAHAGASHMLEGFRPIRNKWDELVDGIRAAMAAKEA